MLPFTAQQRRNTARGPGRAHKGATHTGLAHTIRQRLQLVSSPSGCRRTDWGLAKCQPPRRVSPRTTLQPQLVASAGDVVVTSGRRGASATAPSASSRGGWHGRSLAASRGRGQTEQRERVLVRRRGAQTRWRARCGRRTGSRCRRRDRRGGAACQHAHQAVVDGRLLGRRWLRSGGGGLLLLAATARVARLLARQAGLLDGGLRRVQANGNVARLRARHLDDLGLGGLLATAAATTITTAVTAAITITVTPGPALLVVLGDDVADAGGTGSDGLLGAADSDLEGILWTIPMVRTGMSKRRGEAARACGECTSGD